MQKLVLILILNFCFNHQVFNTVMTDLSMASWLGKRISARPSCIILTTWPRQLLPRWFKRDLTSTRQFPLPLKLFAGRLLTINSVISPSTAFSFHTKHSHVIIHAEQYKLNKNANRIPIIEHVSYTLSIITITFNFISAHVAKISGKLFLQKMIVWDCWSNIFVIKSQEENADFWNTYV